MLVDMTAVHSHGQLTVIAECQIVLFKDFSTLVLHRVVRDKQIHVFLRAVEAGHSWLTFDLRSASRSLAVDIIELPARDTDGLVMYSLRRDYAGAQDLQRHLRHHAVDLSDARLELRAA